MCWRFWARNPLFREGREKYIKITAIKAGNKKGRKDEKGEKTLRAFFHLRSHKVQGKQTILSNYTSCSNNIGAPPMSRASPVP